MPQCSSTSRARGTRSIRPRTLALTRTGRRPRSTVRAPTPSSSTSRAPTSQARRTRVISARAYPISTASKASSRCRPPPCSIRCRADKSWRNSAASRRPLATSPEDLAKLPGFSRDIKAAREEAKKLLAEAGVPNLKFQLWNRNLAMPYTPAGIFLVDQWRQIGVEVEHKQSDTSPYIAAMTSGNFDVAIDFSNLFMDDSTLALAKFLSFDKAPQNMSRSKDPELDKLYEDHIRERDPAKRKARVAAFEKRLFEQAYQQPLLWWHRIVPTHKTVMGWKMSPSHNLGQELAEVWLNT